MRIAVVCPYDLDRPGGVQHQAHGLTAALRALGHDAWIVAPGTGDHGDARLVGSATRVRVNRSVAPIALRPQTTRQVLRAVRGADVIHLHEPLIPLVCLTVLTAVDAVLVGTFHAAPAGWIHYLYSAARPLLRPLARRLAAATAVSPLAAEPARRLLDGVAIIPNAIDLAAYQPQPPDARRPNRVVFVGRDDPRKGLSILLAAWPAVRAAAPEAELVVVGATRPAPVPGVRFLGRVDEATKRQALAQAAVLCSPNTGSESFGIVPLEGMAAGCAVIAADLPAFRSVLGDAGAYTRIGDAHDLAARITDLLQRSDRIAELAVSGRRHAQRFDWSAVARQYLECYQQACSPA